LLAGIKKLPATMSVRRTMAVAFETIRKLWPILSGDWCRAEGRGEHHGAERFQSGAGHGGIPTECRLAAPIQATQRRTTGPGFRGRRVLREIPTKIGWRVARTNHGVGGSNPPNVWGTEVRQMAAGFAVDFTTVAIRELFLPHPFGLIPVALRVGNGAGVRTPPSGSPTRTNGKRPFRDSGRQMQT
jgi:hypothetical protein